MDIDGAFDNTNFQMIQQLLEEREVAQKIQTNSRIIFLYNCFAYNELAFDFLVR